MDENLLKLIFDLKDALKKETCIIELNKIEKIMENDDEIKVLSYKLDLATTAYSDALKIYDKESLKIKPYYDGIINANDALNKNEIIINYYKYYREVKNICNEINEILFKPFNEKIRL